MNSESTSSNPKTEEIFSNDPFKAERVRHQYYNFLRRSRKPKKGSERQIVFPKIGDDESIEEFYARCHKETGAIPSPVIPQTRRGK